MPAGNISFDEVWQGMFAGVNRSCFMSPIVCAFAYIMRPLVVLTPNLEKTSRTLATSSADGTRMPS